MNTFENTLIEPLLLDASLEDILDLIADNLPRAKVLSGPTRDHVCPAQDEQDGYYYGVPSQPKLIARTSTFKWTPERVHGDELCKVKKQLVAVGLHRAAVLTQPGQDMWEDLNEVLYCAHGLQTTNMQIVRVKLQPHLADLLHGKSSPYKLPPLFDLAFQTADCRTEAEREGIVTLIVDLKSNSVSWSVALKAALECKEVLEEYGCAGIEVEIREPVMNNGQTGSSLPSIKPYYYPRAGKWTDNGFFQ